MWFWTKFSIFIYVTSSACAQLQNTQYLQCPDKWIDGNKITLELRINTSLFPSLCNGGTNNMPYFEKKNTASGASSTNCTVPDITTGCSSFQPEQLGCGCVEQTNENYIVRYNFNAHPDYNGWWTAQLPCVDSSGAQQLTFTEKNCDDKQVIPDTCKNITCLNGGMCNYDSNNTAKCNCSAGYTGDRCELSKCKDDDPCVRGTCLIDQNGDVLCDCTETGYVGPFCDDLDPYVKALISVATFLGFILLSPFIAIKVMVTDYERMRVFDVMTPEIIAAFAVFLGSDVCIKKLKEFNAGTVGLKGSVHVTVCGQGLNTLTDKKPPRILVSGKLIWYFPLNTRADEVEEWFLEQIKQLEPGIDYPGGVQR